MVIPESFLACLLGFEMMYILCLTVFILHVGQTFYNSVGKGQKKSYWTSRLKL